MAVELVVPIRFDHANAAQSLKAIGTQGQQAGDEVAAGFQGASGSAKDFFSAMAGFNMVQQGLQKGASVIQDWSQGFKESADYLRGLSKEFAAFRKSMQEVATLSGKPGSTAFTLDQAQKAKAASLTPAEFRDFQTEFLNYAGVQVGEGGKLTTEQGEEYGARVAEFMKASGVSPKAGAELAGALLENVQGPQDVNKLMSRLGTSFQVLQKGRVPLERALPEISQIMGMGVGLEEASQMYSIVSPAAAGGEGTAVQAALRAVTEMKSKGTGEEFGVRKGMTQWESVQGFAKNVDERKKALMAGGATEQMAQDEVLALLMEKKVANDIREARGLVSGFGRQGVELGGFERYAKIAAETPADYEIQKRKEYEASEPGIAAKEEATTEVTKLERGARGQALLAERAKARQGVLASGELERPESIGEKILTKAGEAMGQGTREEQLINMEANRAIRQGLMGYQAGREYLARDNGLADQALAMGRGPFEEKQAEAARELKRLRENSEKQREAVENRPIPAAPPGGLDKQTRMGEW